MPLISQLGIDDLIFWHHAVSKRLLLRMVDLNVLISIW